MRELLFQTLVFRQIISRACQAREPPGIIAQRRGVGLKDAPAEFLCPRIGRAG